MSQEIHPLPLIVELQQIFDAANAKYFDYKIPPHTIEWNTRLRTTGANISVWRRHIKMSKWLHEANPGHIESVLHHEMIHAYLHAIGHNYNHTPEFKDWLEKLGYSRKIQHSMHRQRGLRQPAVHRNWLPFFCIPCKKSMIKWFDAWTTFGDNFKRVQAKIQNRQYVHKDCQTPLIHIYYRGFTTRVKAIEIAETHNTQAEYIGDRGVEFLYE